VVKHDQAEGDSLVEDAANGSQQGERQGEQQGPDGSSSYGGQGGSFPSMNFGGSGDYNQMQMMMAMQNGMQPNGFGGFPMMGMYPGLWTWIQYARPFSNLTCQE
jgi:hypothetical protein